VAKEDNLIPQAHVLTVEEQSAGGKKSGEVRRERATMKKVLEDMLKETNNTGLTYQQLATLGLIKGATKGNAQNYKTIIEMLGEVPKEQFNETKEPVLNINITNNEDVKEEFYKEEE
jgi:hypothetical protein